MNDVAVKDLGLDIHKQVVKLTNHDKRHGGPYDRGTADSYYRRGNNPHYFVGDTHKGTKIDDDAMTDEEIRAYEAGYNDNEKAGEFKDWG